jgi:hypothetical protein
MMQTMVIAHGGTAGAIGEVLAFLLPLALFAVLAWRAKRASDQETAQEDADEASERRSTEEL